MTPLRSGYALALNRDVAGAIRLDFVMLVVKSDLASIGLQV